MRYLKLFEKFQKEIIPHKFHDDIEKLEQSMKQGDLDRVIALLDNLRRNSKDDPQEDIYFKTHFPAEELEKTSGVSGLSNKWKMPFNMDEEHIENLSGIFINDEEITDIIFNELLKLNPELNIFKDVEFSEGEEGFGVFPKNAVIGGACSRFNVRDILDFIESRRVIDYVDSDRNHIFKSYDRFYTNLYNNVKKTTKDIGYFPSPYTLNKILKNENGNYRSTSWTMDIDGRSETITIHDVEDHLKDVDITEIPVSEIADLSIHKDKKDKATLDRVQRAILDYPIIIVKKQDGSWGMILDGHHRLQKAINNNIETIKAKVLDIETAPDLYKKMFN